MQTITFSEHKKTIACFQAEALNVEKQPDGLLISAEGEMTQQDTPLLENYLYEAQACHVQITQEEDTVVSDRFTVTFFTCEQNMLVVRLS